MAAKRRYWLMKSEPVVYGIDDLERDGTTCWDGVRNYWARNFMRDDMRVGDLVLYYHSNALPAGVAGIAKVVKESYPDHTQFDPSNKYHDAKATEDDPRWFMVDVGFVERFREVVPLAVIKAEPDLAEGMMVAQKGSRLSVQPVEKAHFDKVRAMGRKLMKTA